MGLVTVLNMSPTLQGPWSTFLLKAEECLKQEEERADSYVPAKSRERFLVISSREVLFAHKAQLLGEQDNAFAALLRNNKVASIPRDLCI